MSRKKETSSLGLTKGVESLPFMRRQVVVFRAGIGLKVPKISCRKKKGKTYN